MDSEEVKKAKEHPGYREDDISGFLHRQLIGYIGLVLPLILIFLAILRDGVGYWRGLKSVSAYYYSGAVAAFVGMLVALSLFLFTYRGYGNKHNRADRWVSTIAAVAALIVAVFPTKAPDCAHKLSWWNEFHGILHIAAAVVLFLMFAVFALFLFRLRGKEYHRDKAWRNWVFLSCGIIILASMVWALVNHLIDRSIFWPESLALAAFAVSWLVKGYAYASIAITVRRLFHRKASLKK